MTSQEYITRKAAGTVSLPISSNKLSMNQMSQEKVIVSNEPNEIELTITNYDPITGEATQEVDTITIDAVQSEINQLQVMLDYANTFLSDLQAA